MKRINQDISENQFQKVYLLCGEEAYLRNQYRDKLIAALVNEGDTMNFSAYSGKDIPVPEIIDLAETMPFLADKRVILIEDAGIFGAKGSSEEIAEYLKTMPDSVCMIFSEEDVDKRSKMYKAVKAAGYVAEFGRLTADDLRRWVLSRLKSENRQITQQALDDFLGGTGDDMMRIKSELEKLISYTFGKEGITSSDVEAVCTPQIEDKIFAMLDHMMNKRTEQALALYGDLLALREAPGRILYMIERQLRMMLHVKAMQREGKSQDQMATVLGANPYAIKKMIPQAMRLDEKDINRAIERCADTEEDSKSGRIDAQIGVELLIVEIAGGIKK